MRHRLIVVLMLGLVASLLPAPSFAEIEEVRIGVDGLTCNLCAIGLERSLRKIEGVASVRVTLEDELAVVKLKAGAVFDRRLLDGAIKDAGQQVRTYEIRARGTVVRRDGVYTLQSGGVALAVDRASSARLEPHIGKSVRVRASIPAQGQAPLELQLLDVAAR